MTKRPTLDLENALLTCHEAVVGIDEVGRGALAGPVCVGAAVVTPGIPEPPAGLRDSKLIPATARRAVRDETASWVASYAVGNATPQEIDAMGIVAALRLAAVRALETLHGRGFRPTAAILDGTHNWLEPATPIHPSAVVVRAKADRDCAVVAAASVLAKVHRDELMCSLADPGYEWAANKGYGSRGHLAAIETLGASMHHRLSWRLPVA